MRQLEKIIVGYNFQPGSDVAAHCAADLASRCGAQVKLVHVIEPMSLYQRLSHPLTSPYSIDELVERAGERLRTELKTSAYSGVQIDYEVRTGKPFVELIHARHAWQADLIVVGSRQDGQALSIGTTSEYVVRKAMAPVWVANRPLTDSVKTILVPTDFSDCATKAAEEAIALARHFSGRLIFVHVKEPILSTAYPYDPMFGAPPSMPTFKPQEIDDAIEYEWQEFIRKLPLASPLHWEQHSLDGLPTEAIVTAAEQYNADLLVMGTHGRTGLSQMLLGSVAEGIIRRAACSVLTVRPEGFQFTLP
jgi:nucleotide-binding universal stress UspA family protein